MNPNKKTKSKPAAAKKTAIKSNPKILAPGPGRELINLVEFGFLGIAGRVKELESQLKTANQKLDYLLVRAAPLNREDWPPIVEQAEEALEKQ